MTIHEIKRRTIKTSPYFFSRENLRFFGQVLRDFKVRKQADGRYLVTAPAKGKHLKGEDTIIYFNPINDRLERI